LDQQTPNYWIPTAATVLVLVWCFFIFILPYWVAETSWWSFVAAGLFAKWRLRKSGHQHPAVTQSWAWDLVLISALLMVSLAPLLMRIHRG
jgi:hypothetical protein